MSKTLSKMNLISVVQQLPKEDIETIQGYVEMIEELKNKYNIRLLNQISENIEPDCEDYYLAEIETKAHKYDLIQNQQKEFIKWLEEKEKRFDMIGDPINSGACCGILQKYKKIIGVSDENNIK